MWDYGYNEETMVNLRDSVPGIVKGQSKAVNALLGCHDLDLSCCREIAGISVMECSI